jgi:hypothetical protein
MNAVRTLIAINQRPTPLSVGRCSFVRLAQFIACVVAAATTAMAGNPVLQTRPAPDSRPAGVAAFAPGVGIDWPRRAVLVDAEVVLRRGPLEFLACRPGKEHESILRLNASATHIYLALGLIGLQPGHPPIWNETTGDYERAAGDLLDVECDWQQEGQLRHAPASEWLREIEYARTPIPRPWVFAGSVRVADGSLAADQTGAAFAVVDFPESLITLSGRHSSSNADLWLEADCERIPPVGTPVRLKLRPALPRACEVRVDFRGAPFMDGRYIAPADLADLLLLARQLEPERIQIVKLCGTLHSDQEALLRELRVAGCPDEAIRFEPSAQPAPATGPQATP